MGNCIPLFLGGENMPFYVPPDSVVKILRGVPLDIEHEHTLWFATQAAQTTYFESCAVSTFTSVTYARKNRGIIKLQVPIATIKDCDYMMFKNTGFENKWFYAFIVSVDYVSNNVTQVAFIIDQLQTWFFEMQLAQCYVEREHANHDVAGDNLIPEALETGEYIYEDNDYDWCHEFTSYDVVVYTTFSSSSSDGINWVFTGTQGSYRWGIYTGLNIRVFRTIENQATITSINAFVTQAYQYMQDGIIAMIMIPHEALDNNYDPTQISHTIPKITSIDGYVPRNKKLLTSPYVFIEANNCEGAVAALPQEYFGGTNPAVCQFMITFNITCAPVAICVPINYKNSEYCLTEALYINNFSQCSYNTDLFKAYMAQSLTAQMGKTITDMIGGAGSFAKLTSEAMPRVNQSGGETPADFFKDLGGSVWNFTKDALNVGGRGLETIGNLGNTDLGRAITMLGAGAAVGYALGDNVRGRIFNDLSEMYAKSVQAPHNTGANTPDYLTSNRLKGFWFFHRTIRNEYAQIIDSYFDRYGYATKKTKIPNIHVRQNWTYTKTIGCEINGNIPIEAKTEIKNCFNNGITFWTTPANVGNYNVSNGII